MRKKLTILIAAALLSLAIRPVETRAGAPGSPPNGISVTSVQRELQARYFVLSSNYIVWPPCPCGSPAPHFPPEGFYGDLDKDRVLAASLAQNIADNFYTAFFASGHWLKTNSLEGLQINVGTGYVVPPSTYTLTDVPSSVGSLDLENPTTNNYGDCLKKLSGYVTELNLFLGAPGWGNVDPDTNDFQYFTGGDYADCEDAIDNGYYIDLNTGDDVSGWSPDDWAYMGDEKLIGYVATALENPPYAAIVNTFTVRGEPAGYPNAPGYTSGQITIYLQGYTNGYDIGSYPPPVTVDGQLHYFASGQSTNQLPFLGSPIANFTPSITCDEDDGWWIQQVACIVAPVFNATPDLASTSGSGCGCGSGSGVPGSCSANTGCMNLQISLGPDSNGQSAGYFYVEADTFSANLPSPASLQLALAADVTTSLSSGVGTVTTPNVTATVATSGSGYGIWFSNNLTPQSFLASVTVASTVDNQLTVTETIGSSGSPRVMVFQYTPSTTNWTLTEGSGVRNESRNTVWSSPTNNRTDTIIVSNASGTVATQTTEVSQLFPWGLSLLERTEGTGSAAKTTSWTYYPESAGSGSYGNVASTVDSTGQWTWYQYDSDGRLTNEVSALEDNLTTTNAGSNRQTETIYDDTVSMVTTIRLIAGTEVGRTYEIDSADTNNVEEYETITCTVAGAAIGASSNLTNTMWRTMVASGAMNAFDTMTNRNADGTMSLYSYGSPGLAGGGTGRSVTVFTGAPNAGRTAILDGTETVSVYGTWGELWTNLVTDIASGLVLARDTYVYSDALHRSYTVTHLDGTTEAASYACCGLDTTTDRDGVTTQYYYDDAKRQVATARLGITTSNVLDAVGNVMQTIRIGRDGSQIALSRMAYDNSETLVYETNALNGVTTHAQATNGVGETIYTVTNPDGGTVVTTNYVDGTLARVGGTGANWMESAPGADSGGAFTYSIKVSASGGTNEWSKSYTDMAGRASGTAYPDGSFSTNFYNNLGQMTASEAPDSVVTLYGYNPKGEPTTNATDMNGDGAINTSGNDRITFTTNDVIYDSTLGVNVQRSRTYVWSTIGMDAATLVAMTETSVDGLRSWQTRYGPATVTSESLTAYNLPYRTNIVTAENGSSVVTIYTNGVRQSVTLRDASGSQIGKTTYTYDAHGRVATEIDARNGTTSYAYNNADQADATTTPPPSGSGSGLTTLTSYNAMLQPTNVVYPDGTSVMTTYTLDGNVAATSGSRTYAVGYSYDGQGRMLTMTNWGQAGTEVTTWKYDGARGWLTNKLDNSGYGPAYTYTSTGQVATRTWARGKNTAYGYDAAGGLLTVVYSDGTPAVTNTYDRLGRRIGVGCNGINTTLNYDSANDPLGEIYSGGILNGLSITNGYDGLLRRTNNVVLNGGTILTRTTNSYDAAGRLFVVSDTTNTATYSYVANAPLVDHIVFAHSGSAKMTNQNTYDYVNRLTGKTSVSSAASVFNYQYNTASQRTKVSLVDGSYWVYQYDNLGQLTNGVKYFSDGTPYSGQQFQYGFDTIGNRTGTATGGNQTGASLQVASYTNNALNQITSRSVPGFVNVMGLNLATNTVKVNGTNAYQKWEYYEEAMGTNNTSSPQWVGISVTAPGQTAVSGHQFVAQTPETMTYDLDGNLLTDGHWNYCWDGENRLIAMTNNASIPAAGQSILLFAYDYMGRRIEKQVYTNNGSSYVGNYTNCFIYDGWNLAAVVNQNANLLAAFMWGTDLSGSLQGAGGVGGLLAENLVGNGVQYIANDGNGNVVALVATNGTISANYEHGPFGEILRATGPMAKLNPFRFSSKYYDDESDLMCYGYRYYNPSTGRWPSRDPIEEKGGLNLYGFNCNQPISKYDLCGLITKTVRDGVWSQADISTSPVWAPKDATTYGGLIGSNILRFAWIDADTQDSIQSSNPNLYNWVTTNYKWNQSALDQFDANAYIGAGIAIEFVPSACGIKNGKTVSWNQEIVHSVRNSHDSTTSGNFFVDSPGGLISKTFTKRSQTYKLTMSFNGSEVITYTWSYSLDPSSSPPTPGGDLAPEVTLTTPF
jgi:RHS repeat-associated protein